MADFAQRLMSLALEEAVKSPWTVRPNPRVGAALQTLSGEVVSGHHKVFGGPHAEIEVLNECQRRGLSVKRATMAVTLEPCAHAGKTPPCTDALIQAGVARVIVGASDSAKWVDGRGIAALKQAGIEVLQGVLENECLAMNWGWLRAHELGRPYVRIKMATSVDGKWTADDGSSRWITGPCARDLGHELRERSDMVIVGRNTVEVDDPMMTARNVDGGLRAHQPRVCVLSRSPERVSLEGRRLLRQPRVAEELGAQRSVLRSGADLSNLLKTLYQEQVYELLLESGPTLTHQFLEKKLFDEIHLFMGAKFLGGNGFSMPAFCSGTLPGLTTQILSHQLTDDGDMYFILSQTE